MIRRLRVTALFSCCLVMLLSGACGSSSPAPQPVAGDGFPPTASIDPHFDSGQAIIITDDGFRPTWLVSVIGKQVTWVNRSSSTQSVDFDHQNVRSGPLRPGETFVYNAPHLLSATYHSGIDRSMKGKLQVSQNFNT